MSNFYDELTKMGMGDLADNLVCTECPWCSAEIWHPKKSYVSECDHCGMDLWEPTDNE